MTSFFATALLLYSVFNETLPLPHCVLCQAAAKAFIEAGLHRHHSVAIVAANCPQWVICNLAAIMAGSVFIATRQTFALEPLSTWAPVMRLCCLLSEYVT
jgi:hypothetical protein